MQQMLRPRAVSRRSSLCDAIAIGTKGAGSDL